MLDLPHEIWSNIAQFIPASTLEGLISVNSTFYDIAMDSRYRRMSFAFLDNRMLRNMTRLKDPVVAKRVRVLHVYPGFLKQILDHQHDLHLGRRSLRLRLRTFANQLLDHKSTMNRDKLRIFQKFKTADEVVSAMLDVFAGLPNVTDYHIMWSGIQAVPKSPVPLLAALFQSNLRMLALDISLENVASLLTPTCAPYNIEELDLVIRIDHSMRTHDYGQIMIHHLAPAVARLKSSLRKLTIQSWEPLDFSPFFHHLDQLPLLDNLTLGIPVQAPHLGNHTGLAVFLNRQSSTLHSLSLRATQYSGSGLSHDPATIYEWIVRVITGVQLDHLRTLDISSSLFPFSASLVCLYQFASTITSLVLTGCYHTLADVSDVLHVFRDRPRTERLETLRLGSVALTPELLDLLSMELPRLYRLELLVREVTAHSDEYVPASKRDSQIDYFFSEMEKRRYPQWQLRRLKLLLTSFPYRFSYGQHLEQLLATCVPSICEFS